MWHLHSGLPCISSTEAVLNKKEAVLTSTDRTFKLEMSFMNGMVGAGGQARLEQLLLDCMPDKSKSVTLQAMLQHCAQIQNSDLYKFCSRSAQGTTNACQEMLGSLLQGRPPVLPAESTPFLQDFRVKLQFFCRVKGKGGEQLVGQVAIQHFFDTASAKDPGIMTLEELEPLHTFGFLLSAKAQESIQDMTAKVMAKGEGADGKASHHKKHGKKRAQADESSAAPSKANAGKRVKTDLDMAMDMFA